MNLTVLNGKGLTAFYCPKITPLVLTLMFFDLCQKSSANRGGVIYCFAVTHVFLIFSCIIHQVCGSDLLMLRSEYINFDFLVCP